MKSLKCQWSQHESFHWRFNILQTPTWIMVQTALNCRFGNSLNQSAANDKCKYKLINFDVKVVFFRLKVWRKQIRVWNYTGGTDNIISHIYVDIISINEIKNKKYLNHFFCDKNVTLINYQDTHMNLVVFKGGFFIQTLWNRII